jgi:uncharacterized protein YndB with AHSA1/START domain
MVASTGAAGYGAPIESLSFSAETTCSAPPQVVFAVLEDGAGWARWAGLFVPRSRWEREGTPAPGGVGAVRRLGIGPLVSLERVVEHVPGRRLAYVVDSWAPYRGYRAQVDLEPTGTGGTRVVWQAAFTPKVPGTGRALRWFLHRVVAGFARNLAREAERSPAGG